MRVCFFIAKTLSAVIFTVMTAFAASAPTDTLVCTSGFAKLAPKRNPQLVIWELEANGRHEAAEKLRKRVEENLRSAKVKSFQAEDRRAESTGLTFLEFEDGSRGVWKTWPEDGYGSTKKEMLREVVVYQFDRLIGANLVPVTVRRSFQGTAGIVQIFVRETDAVPLVPQPHTLKLFDYLTFQADRINANHLTVRGRTVAIDNERSFMPDADVRQIPQFDKFIDRVLSQVAINGNSAEAKALAINEIAPTLINREVVDKLKTLTDQQWKDGLPGLSAKDLKDFLVRKKKAVAAIERAEKVLGSSMYPAGPFSGLVRDRSVKQMERLEEMLKNTRASVEKQRIQSALSILGTAADDGRVPTAEEAKFIDQIFKDLGEKNP